MSSTRLVAGYPMASKVPAMSQIMLVGPASKNDILNEHS